MEKTFTDRFSALSPYIISLAMHIFLLSLVFSITFINFHIMKKKSRVQSARDIEIESITGSPDAGALSGVSERGPGPYGLNDSAGRELWECARSGISVTPDNFLEYAKIRNLRKGLNPKPKEDIYEKYPFLTGSSQFQSGIGGKLRSDFHECYKDTCAMIGFGKKDRASPEDEPENFTAAVLGYLDGARAVRTWRTLWMVPQPATREDKILLVRLLRRLHNYGIEGENAGHEHMRAGIRSLLNLIPDELKFPAHSDK